jgi:LPXTG-site transpeptidase (sortase) family protein
MIDRMHPNLRMFIFIALSIGVISGGFYLAFHPVAVQLASAHDIVIPNGENGEVYTNEQATTTYYDMLKNAVGNLWGNIKGIDQANMIVIEKIGVRASIESVGLDKDGNMASPSSPDTVAWYKEGAQLGGVGTAVVSGHRDTSTGKVAVFYRLSDLEKGDIILVSDANGTNFKYIVTSTNIYSASKFPTKEIFSSDNITARLNIISCVGEVNRKTGAYSHRIVVSAILQK